MAKASLTPGDTIKVLGVLLDPQLTWEAHNIVAANRARGAMHAVHRAARYLPAKDRATLMEAVSLPYIDYAQAAL
eukprot:gene4939-6571_t